MTSLSSNSNNNKLDAAIGATTSNRLPLSQINYADYESKTISEWQKMTGQASKPTPMMLANNSKKPVATKNKNKKKDLVEIDLDSSRDSVFSWHSNKSESERLDFSCLSFIF